MWKYGFQTILYFQAYAIFSCRNFISYILSFIPLNFNRTCFHIKSITNTLSFIHCPILYKLSCIQTFHIETRFHTCSIFYSTVLCLVKHFRVFSNSSVQFWVWLWFCECHCQAVLSNTKLPCVLLFAKTDSMMSNCFMQLSLYTLLFIDKQISR